MTSARYPPYIGGIEQHVAQVAPRLAALGADVTVVTTDPTGRLPRVEDDRGVALRRVRAWPRGRDYYFAPGVFREITRTSWDVVHVQGYQTLVAPVAMLAALRAGVPYVLTFHAGGHSSRLRHSIRPLQLRVLRPLLLRASRLVALAQFEIDDYSERLRLSRGRFVLIPNGSDLPLDLVADEPRDPSLIASLGRLERYKGHHRVLQALPYVLRRRPDTRLWIAGAGPDEQALRDEARALGVDEQVEIRAVPAGDRVQMARELKRVKVAVAMSEFETQPIAALEAISAGCRLVAADTPGLHALVDARLGSGVRLDASPERLADAIVAALEEPGVKAPPALPSWDDCARCLLRLYEDVARTGSGS